MKYLKVYEGRVSNGRDAGYPETKKVLIENVEQLVNTFDKNAEYFKLQKISNLKIEAAVSTINDLI